MLDLPMAETTLNEETLRQWVGKTESMSNIIDPGQARLTQATFDQISSLKAGDPLPDLWHWTCFLNGVPMSELGRDGHPLLGGFLPPVALPRRMWAGGRLKFTKSLLLGETITKKSTIKDVRLKSGRSGTLCFVTVAHEYLGEDGKLRFSEEHDIVYREDPAPDAPKPVAPKAPDGSQYSETIVPNSVQLFRYSALTFNGHRIHYDRDYCLNVEGYPGLVFHGPLTATLLANLANKQAGDKRLGSFEFRAVSPLFDTAAFTIHSDGVNTFWAQTPDGRLAMKATASFI